MSEIQKIKSRVEEIVQGGSRDFTVLEHEHLNDDVWSITVESKDTKKVYNFKDDGFSFFDFKEKA